MIWDEHFFAGLDQRHQRRHQPTYGAARDHDLVRPDRSAMRPADDRCNCHAQFRQASIGGVVRESSSRGSDGRLDNVHGRRKVRLADFEMQHVGRAGGEIHQFADA